MLGRYFPIEFRCLITDAKRSTEMAEYIQNELERRRHIRVLEPELEEIVKEALVDGADGMYLWVALQLDAIFPLYEDRLLSDSDIAYMMENLPQGLPATFERALGRISDTRYGQAIFKIVAAATRPLTIDELRITLNIEPGNIVWDHTRLPYNGKSVVRLCGGSLLEVDEKSDSVRFIHNSVIHYLLIESPDPTLRYQFTATDAETFLGEICVTYLNLSIFQTQIMKRQNLLMNSDHLAKKVTNLTRDTDKITNKLVGALQMHRRKQAINVDVGPLLQRLQKSSTAESDVYAFAKYANEHLLHHTIHLTASGQGDDKTHQLFATLVATKFDSFVSETPLIQSSLLLSIEQKVDWAIKKGHKALLSALLDRRSEDGSRIILDALLYAYKILCDEDLPTEREIRHQAQAVCLQHAVAYGLWDFAFLFLKRGANPNRIVYRNTTIIDASIRLGNATMVKLLLRFGIRSWTAGHESPLLRVAEETRRSLPPLTYPQDNPDRVELEDTSQAAEELLFHLRGKNFRACLFQGASQLGYPIVRRDIKDWDWIVECLRLQQLPKPRRRPSISFSRTNTIFEMEDTSMQAEATISEIGIDAFLQMGNKFHTENNSKYGFPPSQCRLYLDTLKYVIDRQAMLWDNSRELSEYTIGQSRNLLDSFRGLSKSSKDDLLSRYSIEQRRYLLGGSKTLSESAKYDLLLIFDE